MVSRGAHVKRHGHKSWNYGCEYRGSPIVFFNPIIPNQSRDLDHPASRAFFPSRISPLFCFEILNTGLQMRQIPDPEKSYWGPSVQLKNRTGAGQGWYVKFTRVNEIEAMYERPRVNVKVERGSTFTYARDLPYIVSILFMRVRT